MFVVEACVALPRCPRSVLLPLLQCDKLHKLYNFLFCLLVSLLGVNQVDGAASTHLKARVNVAFNGREEAVAPIAGGKSLTFTATGQEHAAT